MFNDKTLFGKGTIVFIPYEAITVFEKRCYGDMKIFPNSMFVKMLTEKGE
jgi:hypothetical protein